MTKIQSIKESAKAYEGRQTKNVADLDKVDVSLPIDTFTGNTTDGEEFSYKFITVNGVPYRIPDSVLKQLKELLQEKPDLKFFKVKKSGSGLDTSYYVMPL